MKKLSILFFLLIAFHFAYAQTKQDSTHFLWFTGHWSKTKKNVFITTATTDSTAGGIIKMSAGNTVTIQKNGSVTIGGAGIDDWNKKIDDGEKKLDETEKQMQSPGEEISEWSHHFNEVEQPLLDTIKARWVENKVDKKNDILSPNKDQSKESSPEEKNIQKFINDLTKACNETIRPTYQELVNFYNAHKYDKESDYNNPAPPEYEFQCAACDEDAEKNYDEACEKYVENFFKPESGLIKNGLGLIRSLILIGKDQDFGDSFGLGDPIVQKKVDQVFSKSGPCSFLNNKSTDSLNKIVNWLIKRCLWRAQKLVKDYKDNYKVIHPVAEVYLSAARQNALIGSEDVSLDANGDLSKMFYNAFNHYYLNLTEKHDWSQLANIPIIFGLVKQYALLGNKINDQEILSKVLKILNSFVLNIEMDIKVGKDDGGYMLTHLKGTAKIAPEFKLGADSCYEWVVTEDKPDEIGQPLKKGSQKIELNLLDNEVVTPQNAPHYTGTKKYFTTLSQLKMDYCHLGKDTILLGSFIPEPNPMAGTWIYPNDPQPVPAGIFSMEHYFQDINKMKQVAQSGEAQQQANILKEQAEKMATQMKALAGQMNGKRDASQIANYQKMSDMMNQAREMTNNIKIAPITYIDFPLQIQNNTTVLVHKRYDAKEINPSMADKIVYGYFTVDVEYKGQ